METSSVSFCVTVLATLNVIKLQELVQDNVTLTGLCRLVNMYLEMRTYYRRKVKKRKVRGIRKRRRGRKRRRRRRMRKENRKASLTFSGPDWLTDNDDSTCGPESVDDMTLSLAEPFPLTWIRLVVTDIETFSDGLKLQYKQKGETDFTECSNLQVAKVNEKTVDVHVACSTDDVVTNIQFMSDKAKLICSLYINGGRNVVLKQESQQSSTVWAASKAVDGYVSKPDDVADHNRHCSHTQNNQNDPYGYWNMSLVFNVNIYELAIYNRRDPARSTCCEDRLKGFNLKLLHGSTQVFDYTDTEADPQDVYTIVPSPKIDPTSAGINRVHIWRSPTSPLLIICEFEAFGEHICPTNKFGLYCDQDCNCKGGDGCFVSTGGCPSGCTAGYTGEDCLSKCAVGTYGYECSKNCSKHCIGPDNECDHMTGSCTLGCEIGFQNPLCDAKCNKDKFGKDCLEDCNSHCLDLKCNHISGKCESCFPGYKGDYCNQECPFGTFGLNCVHACSEHCVGPDNICNHIHGACDLGCENGYLPPLCSKIASPTTSNSDGSDDNIGMIAVAVGVAFAGVIIAAALIGIYVWRRKNNRNSQQVEPPIEQNNDHQPQPGRDSGQTQFGGLVRPSNRSNENPIEVSTEETYDGLESDQGLRYNYSNIYDAVDDVTEDTSMPETSRGSAGPYCNVSAAP